MRNAPKSHVLVSVLVAAVITPSCSFIGDKAKASYLARGNRYYAQGKYQDARSMYVKAINVDRKFGEAYYRAGITAIQLQRWDEAARNLRIAVDLQPKNEEAYAHLADVYCFAYAADESLRPALLKELQALSARLHEYLPGTYDDERVRAYIALFSKDPVAALKSLDVADRVRPLQEEIVLMRVKTLLALGRVNEASDIASKFLDARPSAEKVYNVLMTHYLSSNRLADFERVARLKVRNNPKIADGYLELAAHFFRTGNLPDMKSALRPIIDRPTEFPNGPLLVGDFYLRIRDWNSAAEYYRSGLRLGGKSKPSYQKRLVEILVKQHRYSEALQLAEEVVKENPTDAAAIAVRASLPVLTEDKARIPEAIKDFREVIGKLPEDFVLRYAYGRALMLSGDTPAAIQSFKEALRFRPDYIWPRVRLAFITLDLEHYEDALELSRGILADEGINVPFDTAGQRPQDRPFYDDILKIKPDTHLVLNKLAEALAATHVAQDEALAMSRRAREELAGRQ